MAKRLGEHFRGNVVAYVALLFALGTGTAWALERNSVKSKHIKTGQVKSVDVANDSRPGALKAADIADLHDSGRKLVNDPPGDANTTSVTLLRSGGVTVTAGCRDNAINIGGNDIANVHVEGPSGTAISLIEANGATEESAANGAVATLTINVSNGSNVLNSGYFVAVEPSGHVVSGSLSAEVNDLQSTSDCVFAATGIG